MSHWSLYVMYCFKKNIYKINTINITCTQNILTRHYRSNSFKYQFYRLCIR